MTDNDKLRKENQTLGNENEELKNKLQRVSDDLSKRIQWLNLCQYDSFIRFKVEAERQIQELISRVYEISVLCHHV